MARRWSEDGFLTEPTIEVGEAEEGLNVFDLLRFQPFLDNFDLFISHCQAKVHQDISEEFHIILLPFSFISFGIETMFPEALEKFTDVLLVLFEIVRIDKDVIER